jgi:hypothetical protein
MGIARMQLNYPIAGGTAEIEKQTLDTTSPRLAYGSEKNWQIEFSFEDPK